MELFLPAISFLAGIFIVISIFLALPSRGEQVPSNFKKLNQYTLFLNECCDKQKGHKISRAQMAESIKIVNQLSENKVYHHIYTKGKWWGK